MVGRIRNLLAWVLPGRLPVDEQPDGQLGLRYQYTPWLTAYRNQGAVFDPTQAKSIIVSSETDQIDLAAQALADVGYRLFGDLIQTSSQAGVPIQLTENDNSQWAPRIGFAYRLGDRTVLRGGYGMFYEAEGTSGRLNFHFLPFSMSETVNAVTNVVPNRTTADYFLGVPFGASVGSVGWNPLTLDADFGYDQRWNFGFQREIASRMSLEMNYVGTKGSNQQEAEPINLPPRRCRRRSGAPAVSALRQHEHSQPGAIDGVSRAADEVPEADVRRILVPSVSYVVADVDNPACAGHRRQLHLRYGSGRVRHTAPACDELRRGIALRHWTSSSSATRARSPMPSWAAGRRRAS